MEDSSDDTAEGFVSNGDAVCWLASVCDECGAITDEGQAASVATCWRCAADLGRAGG